MDDAIAAGIPLCNPPRVLYRPVPIVPSSEIYLMQGGSVDCWLRLILQAAKLPEDAIRVVIFHNGKADEGNTGKPDVTARKTILWEGC